MNDPILLGLLRTLARRPFDAVLQGVVFDRAEEVGADVRGLREFFTGHGFISLAGGYRIVGRRGKRRLLAVVRAYIAYHTGGASLEPPQEDPWNLPF